MPAATAATAATAKRKRACDGAGNAAVRRVYPRFVDGGSAARRAARYDPETCCYDVRDVLLVAFGTDRSVKRAMKLAPGIQPQQRIKWSDCDRQNAGIGRVVMPALACAELLKRCLAASPRAPLTLTSTEGWMRDLARRGDAPVLLDELSSTATTVAARRNEHRPHRPSPPPE